MTDIDEAKLISAAFSTSQDSISTICEKKFKFLDFHAIQ